MAAQSRTLRNGIISLAVFFALVVGLLLGVPGLRSAGDRISDANGAWVVAGIVLELLSCVGYVVLFGLVFGGSAPLTRGFARGAGRELGRLGQRPGRDRAGRLGAAEEGGVGRADREALGLVFVLASAVNVAAVVAIGVPMWLGLLPGSVAAHAAAAAAALATILGTLALAASARRTASSGRSSARPYRFALSALSGGVEEAVG